MPGINRVKARFGFKMGYKKAVINFNFNNSFF